MAVAILTVIIVLGVLLYAFGWLLSVHPILVLGLCIVGFLFFIAAMIDGGLNANEQSLQEKRAQAARERFDREQADREREWREELERAWRERTERWGDPDWIVRLQSCQFLFAAAEDENNRRPASPNEFSAAMAAIIRVQRYPARADWWNEYERRARQVVRPFAEIPRKESAHPFGP